MRARYDDPASEFTVDWQWCDENAKDIPFPIAFASDHNDPEHVDQGQVGEVRQTFYEKAGTFLPGFLKGDHYCGSKQQWQQGWPAGTPVSPIVDGVPVCCNPDGAPFDFGFSFGFES